MQGQISNRERIRRCLLGQPVDRPPWFLFFGPWPETEQRWRNENKGSIDYDRFDFDAGIVSVNQSVNLGFCPAFQYQVLEESGQRIVYQDHLGIIQESIKGKSGIPHIIRNPVSCRQDWQRLKAERLDPEDPRRFPDNWLKIAARLNAGDAAIQLGSFPYGLFGTLRDLMGVENLLLAFYDQPDLVLEIMNDLTRFWLQLYKKICVDIETVELVHMWEDMSGKQGSLISPAMVEQFMMPNYRKIAEFCREKDIPGFSVDTDGRCDELIGPFMASGVNFLLPFEVSAGNDVVQMHQLYPDLTMLGGIDKRTLSAGPEALAAELERIRPLLDQSRYIPALDHLIPPDVSWQAFCAYSDQLRQMIMGRNQ